MALKDIISINVSGLNAQQRETLQKAFFPRVSDQLERDATYEDVTKELAEGEIERIIKVWCRGVNEAEAIPNYTDMDA